MENEPLYSFYEHAVLPQFGIENSPISWNGSQRAGGDEIIHYFADDSDEYALVFEDYDGLGKNDDFIREHVLEHHADYSIVEPISHTGNSPSYDGFRLPPPSQYCENVTGSFTLIKLLSADHQ